MVSELCKILLIEDESVTADLFKELLFSKTPSSLAKGFSFELTTIVEGSRL
jgi:hypothetical protein